MKVMSVKHVTLDSPKQYYDVINANPYNNFLIKTNTGHICSHNCFFDEVSFQPNADVNIQKKKAKELVNTAAARMQSRFMKGDKNPTLLVVASSKRTEQSYMETFIQTKKKLDQGTTLVVDEPQWVIREDKNSDRKFKVAVGSKFLSSEVLPLDITDAECNAVRNRGYQIIDVPIGYYENFIEDIDVALTDIAGISTTSSNRYISGPRLAAIETDRYQNAFVKEIIEVGNAPEDTTQYWEFFDITRIPVELKRKPLYIHLDMSISGDKTGIGGVFQRGKRPPKEGEPPSKDMYYTVAFNVSVKAPRGYQVSFDKNRKFIRWLKQQGFNIKGISSDTFQSAETQQALAAEGFNTTIISVDRVDSDHICRPYQYLRSTIYEERVECYKTTLLKEELIGLERDNNSGKVDHSPSGINCFTGDTKIALVDGRHLSMEELVSEYENGKTNYVYSLNLSTNRIEPKPILKAWCSGHDAKLVEIELDNGEKIRCTPEHRFMLRDGTYNEAQFLSSGTSLMPLYTKYPDKGLTNYRMYYEPFENRWHYEHRQFVTDMFDEKHLVHHKNCNPKDMLLPQGFKYGRMNHKIISVRFLTETEDVYDIEVADNHNFALTAGVFVHNSKDSADAICGAMWNASQHADEFAIDYGEDFSATIKTSGMSSNYGVEEDALNFENELKNVFAKKLSTSDKSKQMDFGFGPSVPVTGAYISDGILVW